MEQWLWDGRIFCLQISFKMDIHGNLKEKEKDLVSVHRAYSAVLFLGEPPFMSSLETTYIS